MAFRHRRQILNVRGAFRQSPLELHGPGEIRVGKRRFPPQLKGIRRMLKAPHCTRREGDLGPLHLRFCCRARRQRLS